jgi:glutamate 5-kinase
MALRRDFKVCDMTRTFREALGQDIAHRTTACASGKARMIEATSKNYQHSFDKHLGKWASVLVTNLPILEIIRYLNALQVSHPHAAYR